jgi:DNA-directed RNA polymerase subunit RPC12/RpoP
MDIACPECGEPDEISGSQVDGDIVLTCGACGHEWQRDLTVHCPKCAGTELRRVPLAIVEKGRGSQLSIVGTRTIHLCVLCDQELLEHWHNNRPNPMMPDDLPTSGV